MKSVLLLAALFSASPAWAQGWSFDARRIGMGATGSGNVLMEAIDDDRGYRAVVLPIGLIQVLRDLDVFRPGSERFDLVKSVEYAAVPLHFVIERDAGSSSGRQLVVDLRRATLSRDLNAYRGFVPARQPAAEGLSSPRWGGTIPVWRGDGVSHSIYLGAGPYLALRTELDVDDRLLGVLASDTDVYLPNSQLRIGNLTRGEWALAFTGGYRGRMALATERPASVYLSLDYSYLRGFQYEQIDASARLDTDGGGLLTFNVAAPVPLRLVRDHSKSGSGVAIDFGAGVVIEQLEVGLSLRGLANHIDWRNVQRTQFTLGNLFAGNDLFSESAPVSLPDRRVELPIDARVSGAYRTARRVGAVEIGRGFQGTLVRFGFEERLGFFDVRGGSSYSRERWQPAAGIGFNFTPRIALDLALFGTSANVERERKAAVAASIRLGRND